MIKKFLCLLFIFNLFIAAVAFSETIEIVCEEEWKPYVWKEGKDAKGFSPEVLDAVFNSMGVKYTITPYPWARAEKNGT
ncbi:MAG: transporter substrate-binding domain-containing protein [Desulfobacterales bacterium]|nr:transporter substrate-binding domain-containing protein [Desulfobacterales bacterium]